MTTTAVMITMLAIRRAEAATATVCWRGASAGPNRPKRIDDAITAGGTRDLDAPRVE